MATTKHLDPTNVDISIPAMTDQPNASVFSNCVDKEADAINALNSKLNNKGTFLLEGMSWSNSTGWGTLQSFIPHANANNLTISSVTCVTYKGNSDYATTIAVHTRSADGFCVRTTDTSVAGYPFRIEFTAS